MTLTEYKNQENPVRMPHVILQNGEFSIGHFKGCIGNKFASVYIDGIEGAEYVAKENDSHLYTTDEDGNPKSISCFYLPK